MTGPVPVHWRRLVQAIQLAHPLTLGNPTGTHGNLINRPFDAEHALVDSSVLDLIMTIPGVGRQVAEVIVAEVGLDIGVFPTAGHLASWAGICPGNNSSGGKRRAGPTRHGSMWLRIALTEAAQAAARTKGTYLASHHAQIRGRRGTYKAIGATRHDILIAYYHIQQTRRLLRQLEKLGMNVTITPAT